MGGSSPIAIDGAIREPQERANVIEREARQSLAGRSDSAGPKDRVRRRGIPFLFVCQRQPPARHGILGIDGRHEHTDPGTGHIDRPDRPAPSASSCPRWGPCGADAPDPPVPLRPPARPKGHHVIVDRTHEDMVRHYDRECSASAFIDRFSCAWTRPRSRSRPPAKSGRPHPRAAEGTPM